MVGRREQPRHHGRRLAGQRRRKKKTSSTLSHPEGSQTRDTQAQKYYEKQGACYAKFSAKKWFLAVSKQKSARADVNKKKRKSKADRAK